MCEKDAQYKNIVINSLSMNAEQAVLGTALQNSSEIIH